MLGVIFATGYLIAAILYYTILPTLLNLAFALLGALLLCRGRSTAVKLAAFAPLCLMFTFGTRLPDFIGDALTVAPDERAIDAVLSLDAGDTLNVGGRITPVSHRARYFGTPSLSQGDWIGRLVPAGSYSEDFARTLLARGLRLNYGVPDPAAPTLRFESETTATHQHLDLRITQGGLETARLVTTERVRFLEELGDQGWLRLHVQHLLEDTLWNWIARLSDRRQPQPITRFLDAAIRVDAAGPVIHRPATRTRVQRIDLKSLDEGALAAGISKGLDCAAEDALRLPIGQARTTIVHPDYEVFVEWPIDDVGPGARRLDSTAGIERATCGMDGYLIVLADNGPDLRLVLVDSRWRPTAAIDFNVPSLARTGGHQRSIVNLYQDGESVHLQVLMKALRPQADAAPYALINVEVEHELLVHDYGGQAGRWPTLGMHDDG